MRQSRSISLKLFLFLSVFIWNGFGFAQGKPKIRTYGDDSLNCLHNLNNLHELVTAAKMQDALPYWHWVSAHCPAASENSYIEGASLYNGLIENEKDSVKRQAFVDTLMNVYDQRIKYFKKEGFVLGRKGVAMYQLSPKNTKEAFLIMKKSMGYEFYNSRPSILVNCFNAALDLLAQRKLDTLEVYDVYDQIRSIVDYDISQNKKDVEQYMAAKKEVEKAYNAMSPCDELEAKYEPVFMRDTSNVDQMITIIHAFEKCHCNGSRFYLYLISRIFDMHPSAMNAIKAGNFMIKTNHVFKAKLLYEVATRFPDTIAAYRAYMVLSDFYIKQYVDYTNSSIQLEAAIRLCPDSAEAYLAMGDLFCLTSTQCNKTDFDRRTLFWIATDWYINAKNCDPSATKIADEKIKAASANYPTTEVLKEHGLKDQDLFQVECWVNKPTTVRARP
ncbi:MAG: hypothetical protein WCO63_08720 [Bacteroidota bacterium]